MSGAQMYGRLCTSCHGVGGTGNGPMAPLLNIDVPDLTRIAQRHAAAQHLQRLRPAIDQIAQQIERVAAGREIHALEQAAKGFVASLDIADTVH